MTFVGALRVDRIDAPCVFDGPINGDLFRAYVEQMGTSIFHRFLLFWAGSAA